MKFVEVEYNQDLKPLETVLSAVKRPGDFFVSGGTAAFHQRRFDLHLSR